MTPSAMRLIPSLLAAAALAASLAGCGSARLDKDALADRPLTPTDQYPLKAVAHPDEIRLAVRPGGLSLPQSEAVAQLANRWLDAGSGTVTIQVPTRGADLDAATRDSLAARSLLVSMGVPSDRVQRVGYDPEAGAGAPLVVGYAAYEAVIPSCGHTWENVSNSTSNKTMVNFGCAVQANMAAQIANPADLVMPRATGSADAGRRSVVLDKYRHGDVTSSAKDGQASGAVSAPGGSS